MKQFHFTSSGDSGAIPVTSSEMKGGTNLRGTENTEEDDAEKTKK